MSYYVISKCEICGKKKGKIHGKYCYNCGIIINTLKKKGVNSNEIIEISKNIIKMRGNKMQQDILEEIRKSPGIYPKQILERVNISRTILYDQLRRLERWNKIEKRKEGSTYRCFSK